MKHWLMTILLVSLAMPAAWAQDYMKAFPPAEAGMVRHVLQLPTQDDASAFKVELVVGKTVQTDAHNRHFFAGARSKGDRPGAGRGDRVAHRCGSVTGKCRA